MVRSKQLMKRQSAVSFLSRLGTVSASLFLTVHGAFGDQVNAATKKSSNAAAPARTLPAAKPARRIVVVPAAAANSAPVYAPSTAGAQPVARMQQPAGPTTRVSE